MYPSLTAPTDSLAPARPAAPPLPDAAPAVPVDPPGALALAAGLSGYLVLGAVFAAGMPTSVAPLALVPTFFIGAVGGVLFTLPALLVLQGSLRLPASPGAVVGALARAVSDIGRVALAGTPVALLFVAAGGIVPLLHVVATLALGALGLWTGARALVAVEPGQADWPARLGLTGVWLGVTGAVGATLIVAWLQLVRA